MLSYLPRPLPAPPLPLAPTRVGVLSENGFREMLDPRNISAIRPTSLVTLINFLQQTLSEYNAYHNKGYTEW